MIGETTLKVVVTAGASGLGLAVAKGFLGEGAAVWICDVDRAALASALDSNPDLRGALADVGATAEMDAFIARAADDLGGLDVLVNNAGIAGPNGPIEQNDPEAWRGCLRVNLEGAFNCIRAAVPRLKAQGGGSIVNISTVSVRTGLPNRSAYVAAKAGLEGLTRTLARELGPSGIRVNAIQPGLLDGERARGIIARLAAERNCTEAEVEAGFLAFISLGCWIDPREVADMILFLTSPRGRHITGQIIGVCGNLEWES